MKNLPGNVGQKTSRWEMSYADYLKHLISDESVFKKIDSYQTRYLLGNLDFNFKTINNLVDSQKLLLFPLREFDDACIYLENKFPAYFSDTFFVKRNINPTHLSEKEEELEAELSSKLVQDVRLLLLAEKQFSGLINIQFTPQELAKARKEFRYRCWQRRLFYEPIQRLTGTVHRLTSSW